MCGQFLPLLDEQRQIAQFAVFHNEVDVGRRFDAVMEGNDVRVAKLLEDLDFAIQIVLELFVQSPKLDRFDSNEGT